ncbi:MAG: ABC transporter permease [Symploca sp. SIO1A3]|nr:ABC transporter permease [Symploca sp. SIO2C1]NER47372.1 ABC transporter permease [Symploca sp. SIO1A3]
MNHSADSSPLINAEISRKSLPPTVFWRLAEDIPQLLSWSLIALSLILPYLGWWLLSNFAGIEAVFLPSPNQVGEAFVRLWEKGFLRQDTAASFIRVTSGFVLAAIVSVPLGISMGAFASIRALTEPIIGILRYMPAPAFIPLLILYLGINEEPKILLIFIGTIFYNTLMIMDAVKFVPKDLIEATYTLGGNRKQILFQVITPYIVPNIIDAFRINIATSWNLVIVSELVAAEQGLGKRILLAQKFLKTDEIFACLIVLGVIGFSLDLLFRWFLRISCKWAFD